MTDLDRWLVALDDTSTDVKIIRYTCFLASFYKPKKVFFVHVIKESDEERVLKHEFERLKNHVQNEIRLKFQYLFRQNFDQCKLEYELIIKTGNVTQELLDASESLRVDLVIAGRKSDSDSQGIVPERISRKISCNFLMVPEGASLELKKIIVPSDFSDYALLAMDMASRLFSYHPIYVHHYHVYQVPMGFSKLGKSYDEFAEIIHKHADEKMKLIVKKYRFDHECNFDLKDNNMISNLIFKKAQEIGADLIILGSKGLTSASYSLLGSTSTRVLAINKVIPALIVKKEGENIGLLEAIGKL